MQCSLTVVLLASVLVSARWPSWVPRHHQPCRLPLPVKPFKVEVYNQTLDHFNAEDSRTFPQRFLVNDSAFRPGGPIFAFTGAEGGDVEGVFYAMGFPFELCLSLGGVCVFLEHRFFGKSLPFHGNGSWIPTPQGIGLLSLEQSMRDYAAILAHIRDRYTAWDAPLVTFGGSLSGTLAALMRVHHPEVVDIAFAASSPILGWVGTADQFSWRAKVTSIWNDISPGCSAHVQRGYTGLFSLSPDQVAKLYRTCEPPDTENGATVDEIVGNLLEEEAFMVYPPGLTDIAGMCRRMAKAEDPTLVFPVLLNTPASSCLNLTAHRLVDNSPDSRGWLYLACSEILHPIGANNETDMFPPQNYSVESMVPYCQGLFGKSLHPRPLQIPRSAGLLHLDRFAQTTSHILFSYGSLDPWATMGMPHSLSPDLQVLVIPNATHCSDLVGQQPDDTPAMIQARINEAAILKAWIAEVAQRKKSP